MAFTVAAQENAITLEKIWKSGEFSPRGIAGVRSMNDGRHYSRLVTGGKSQYIVKFKYEDGEPVDTLVRSSDLVLENGKNYFFTSYEFDQTEERILFTSAVEPIYRHSYKANYYLYHLNDKRLHAITDFEKGKQSLAALSPKSNQVAFVRDNNLFISDVDKNTEIQVTTDGAWNHIINGAVDWVYEEEFSFHVGFHWSPEGSQIAYYKFDEKEVPMFSMAMYGGLYPDAYTFKYPKAGERNSEVRIHIYNLAQAESREVQINANPEQYVPRIKWTQSDDHLCVMRLNRHQNHLEFLLADTRSTSKEIPTKLMYEERATTYIDINDNLIFLNDGKHFIWNSERDGWNHIYLHDLSGKEVGRLTAGQWEVIDFYGVDQKNEMIYFSAAIDSPLEKGVYAAPYGNLLKSGKSGKLKPIAISRDGGTHDADFSSNFNYYINTHSDGNLPPRFSLHLNTGEEIRALEENTALRSKLETYALPQKEFGAFTAAGGHSLNYWMIKPKDFDPDKQYPMVFMVYGGPGSNKVNRSWGGADYMWHQMLAQNGYIIVSVDPRGTMRRGRQFKHSTYMNLGALETEDFMSAAEHFGGLAYIDAARIGIMGWSYGGYMSSLCITKGAELFRLAIAVAPVTNWRYYDSIYTERFLRTPQENAQGYDENSPINFVNKLKGHYLLVHGSADDNVHYQNTMEMVKALVDADKQFDLFIYPNKNHGIYGGNTRHHLYKKMTDFIYGHL